MAPSCRLLVVACAACGHHDEPAAAPPPPSHAVAAATEAIAIDGELSEPSWNKLGDPQKFTHDGVEARPYSQIRFLHDADTLYVGLYAADQDILTSDHFELAIGALSLTVDPSGHIAPAIPGARAAHDLDGTLDKPGDEDEEWVIEMAIPLAAVGAPPLAVHASRCDTPKDGQTRCGEWSGTLQLTPAPPPVVHAQQTGDPRRERDELLTGLQHGGRADEPWVGQAGDVFTALGQTSSEKHLIGCYVAGCGATFAFPSLDAYRAHLAEIEPTDAYRAWTGGKKFTEPEVRADGSVIVGVVLYRPD